MTSRRTREVSYEEAFLKLQTQFQNSLEDEDYDEEELVNFERYVLPALAEATQRPRPIGIMEGTIKCQFPLCGSTLKNKQTFIRHTRTIHGDLLPLHGVFLSRSSSLAGNGRPFVCVECKKPFSRHDHLHQHLSSIINAKCAARYQKGRNNADGNENTTKLASPKGISIEEEKPVDEQKLNAEKPLSQRPLVCESDFKKMNRTLSNLTLSQERYRRGCDNEEERKDQNHSETEKDHE
jgi:hypothetical protein